MKVDHDEANDNVMMQLSIIKAKLIEIQEDDILCK